MSEDYKKNIGPTGSISLLVSSMTGPGIVTIPLIFQTGGWVVPVVTFLIMMVLTAMGSLCLIEAMSKFPGNRQFEQNVEYTVLVHQFYGRGWYYLTHLFIYGSMQSINIASIIVSIQTLDSFLITVFGGTCGFSIAPTQGILCIYRQTDTNSPFDGNVMLMTAGFVLLIALVTPMAAMKLSDNMIIQFVSFVFLCFCLTEWTIFSWSVGAHPEYLSALGSNPAAVVGSVVFNFAFVTTIPSWINSKHPSVNITSTIWTSLITVTIMYIIFGIFGALALVVPQGSNFMVAIQNSQYSTPLQTLIFIAFPILALLTSIPVYIIISRMNLIQSKLCKPGWATFWATIFPFLVVIPFQTVTNFIGPFLIYLFLDKRNQVLAQSVIDELDAMDFMGGERRKRGGEDDDFDYVYHLPHANPDIIVKRDPFSYYIKQQPMPDGSFADIDTPYGGNDVPTNASNMAMTAAALGIPTFAGGPSANNLNITRAGQSSFMSAMLNSLAAQAANSAPGGSNANLNTLRPGGGLNKSSLRLDGRKSQMNLQARDDPTGSHRSLAHAGGSQLSFASSIRKSKSKNLELLTLQPDQPTLRQRLAKSSNALGESRMGSVAGSKANELNSSGKPKLSALDPLLGTRKIDGSALYLEEKVNAGLAAADLINNDLNAFRAFPQWVTNVVPARVLVAWAFALTVGIVVGVIAYDFEQLAIGESPF
ncbi:hypothetical protein SeMB42_g04472 [Synchytrium endobioticum]|uniref:Amino acid transporter transmembrane domain-containing protein n=1 Tax=Synchytrium endobioticum TaxID=286115 RepID=A0A507CXS3_9FUNG|nr:hypothetical protein SeMB42_g04472 [Synchytrium endobioticum]